MTPIELIAKLINILRSGIAPYLIAWGFALGMVIGLTPLLSLHNLFILLLLIIFNFNLGAAIFSWLLFSLFAFIFDPLFHSLGYYLLVEVEWLNGFFTWINSAPILTYGNFNNTVVVGSLAVSLMLLLPVFFFIKSGVRSYREKLEPKIQNTKFVKALKSTKVFVLAEKFYNWRHG